MNIYMTRAMRSAAYTATWLLLLVHSSHAIAVLSATLTPRRDRDVKRVRAPPILIERNRAYTMPIGHHRSVASAQDTGDARIDFPITD